MILKILKHETLGLLENQNFKKVIYKMESGKIVFKFESQGNGRTRGLKVIRHTMQERAPGRNELIMKSLGWDSGS